MVNITWVVETEAFDESYSAFLQAIESAGHRCLRWKEDWWFNGKLPRLDDSPVVFHGSLGNAHRIASEVSWAPGAYCDTAEFLCSAWYERAKPWLVHEQWIFSTVEALIADPSGVAGDLAIDGNVFVRPDSPLKPFSGRVCRLDGISLKDLDHGFYYDDLNTPVVVAPVREVGKEWRFVVVDGEVVAWSGYEASRRAAEHSGTDDALARAREIVAVLVPPEPVYVLDIAQCGEELRLMELNPFSGADLYGCDPAAIVAAVSQLASTQG
ncbi:MAG: ATP-grasp domain-containing protein [Acidobacteriota bacterium]